eukprot:7435825-Pyramimonas_sp.AAC.1
MVATIKGVRSNCPVLLVERHPEDEIATLRDGGLVPLPEGFLTPSMMRSGGIEGGRPIMPGVGAWGGDGWSSCP